MDDFEKSINASDLIDWIMCAFPDWCVGDVRAIVDHVNEMSPAQADGDSISRQAAIDAFWKLDAEIRPSAIDAILNMLKGLPSAQPEIIRCEDKYGYIGIEPC